MAKNEQHMCILAAAANSNSLRSVAGFHNLESYYVDIEHGEQHVIASHEDYHDRFLKETPYGLTQTIFKAVQLRVKDKKLYTDLTLVLNELMRSSQNMHERAATYCSIKSLPVRDHHNLIKSAPPEYQSYYYDIAKVIDGVFHSSYTQFLVAKTLIELALGAPIAERICELESFDKFTILDDESPERRWETIISCLSQESMQEMLSTLVHSIHNFSGAAELGDKFDIQSDTHWESLTLETSTQLDEHLEGLIRVRCYALTSAELSQLYPEKWHESSVRLAMFLEKLTAVKVELISPESRTTVEVDGLALNRAERAAKSSLKNSKAIDFSGVPKIPDEKLGEILEPSRMPIAITRDARTASPVELEWFVFVPQSGDGTAVTRLTHPQLETVLTARNSIALSMGFFPNFEAIIVGADLTEGFPWLYQRLVELHYLKTEKGTMAIGPEKIVWYMSGDLSTWINWLSSLGRLQYMSIFSEGFVANDGPLGNAHSERIDLSRIEKNLLQGTIADLIQSRGEESLCIMTFLVERVPGIFVRIVTSHTSGRLFPLLRDCRVGFVPKDEREDLGKIVLTTLPALASTWSEL